MLRIISYNIIYDRILSKMYTEDSLLLKRYHFSKIDVKGSDELRRLYSYFKNIELLDIEKKGDFLTENVSNVSLDNPFITEEVLNDIKLIKKKTSGSFKIGKITITFTFYYKSSENVEKLINETIDLTHFLFSIYPITKDIEINFYLSDIKKELPDFFNEGAFIPGKAEANSGSCSRAGDKSIVNIWRKEEILKVMVHELIHALCIDEFNDSPDIIHHYQKKYQISSDRINTNEAYTEIWANLINCFWISQKVKKKPYDLFKTFIALEKEHCIFQTSKIFHLTKLNDKTIDINAETNILAYYFIRCELFKELTKFLKFCRESNKDYLKINSKKWFSLLRKNTLLKKNDKKVKRLKKTDFKYKTTRMTAIEYQLF